MPRIQPLKSWASATLGKQLVLEDEERVARRVLPSVDEDAGEEAPKHQMM